jgi:integrase
MVVRTGDLGSCTFLEVWPIWWEMKQQEISEKTQQCYREHFRQLSPFFGGLILKDIHIGNIVAYRAGRQVTAGPGLINHEINALKQLLDYCGLWRNTTIARHYKQLRVRKGSGLGQIPTDEEVAWLLEVSRMKPRWRVASLCGMVSSTTATGQKEVLSLRLKDVDFNNGHVSFIEGTKTGKERPRTLPMNDDCRWALAEIVMLAEEKGAIKPDHYIFPKRAAKAGGKPDPTQHITSTFRAWYALRKFAAKKYPRLLFIERNKLRHYSLTKFASNPNVSEMTVKQMAGHGPYSKMLPDHYVRIRMEAQRVAVDALPSFRKPAQPAEVIPDDPRRETIQ